MGSPVFARGRYQQVQRAPVNPIDKSTVISILPKRIVEVKPTIQPGRFIIESGSYANPSILVVGSSSWWKELEDNQPMLEIINPSNLVADSIVRDYCNGLLACDMGDSMPGLFYIPGNITVQTLKKEYQPLLDKAQERQKKWYFTLIKMADALWSRSSGNPLSISDDMRLAARELGSNTKEWLKDYQNIEMIRCVACGALRNPAYPVCQACNRVIDLELAKKLNVSVQVVQ